MKLDLGDANVLVQSLTVAEIRKASDDAMALSELNDKLFEWLDQCQGDVFTGEFDKVYLVIEITN